MLNFLTQLDDHLQELVPQYGPWIYALLFLVIFAETGFIFIHFFPGDSLLIVGGMLSGEGSLNPLILIVVLTAAAVAGDAVNYWLGHFVGEKLLGRSKLIKQKHIDMTHRFYERYGGFTIVIARFLPAIRSLAPFMAGISRMSYRKFSFYNIMGGILWVTLLVGGSYLLSEIWWQ